MSSHVTMFNKIRLFLMPPQHPQNPDTNVRTPKIIKKIAILSITLTDVLSKDMPVSLNFKFRKASKKL